MTTELPRIVPDPTPDGSLTEEEHSTVTRFAEARRHKGEWEKIEKDLRPHVLQIIKNRGTQALTASGEVAASITTSTRRTVDAKKLEAMYPDVYADVVKETVIEKIDTP